MNIQALGSAAAPAAEERTARTVESAPAPAVAPRATEEAAAAPSRKQVADAIAHINASMPASAKSLEFSVDDDSKQTIVKIIDRNTREVVRQIPTVDALEIAKSMDKLSGLLISQKA